MTDPDVLVGSATGDDAAVYRLSDDVAIVQSVDLFPPVVDDAYDFGRVAAANSLSDLYAMGARPLFALSVVGFPLARLKLEVLTEILRGGAATAAEAGIDIVGGHSIDDTEPKYGLVVTGLVHPDRVYRNSGMRAGDALVLTKPLGTGILSTAMKRGRLDEQLARTATETMATLSRIPAELLRGHDVHACTDITGFGLLGHLGEMVASSHVGARLHAAAVPILPRVLELATEGVAPGGSRRNLDHALGFTAFDAETTPALRLVLADAQTSGGLLVALAPDAAERFVSALAESEYPLPAAVVGEVAGADSKGHIEVIP